jgi:DNA polymerase V
MLRERAADPAGTPRSRVALSFGSPSGGSGATRLDLNEILVRHPQAAFLMRIAGSAMAEAGIGDGDLALIDRALDAAPGDVVIAVVDDEFVCRRLQQQGGQACLRATDPGVADIGCGHGAGFDIWGVVTHVVKPVSA